MDKQSPDLLRPTLMAGLLFGFLGGLPLLKLLNCACCALVVACGFFASYLYSGECRRQGAEFRPGTGALLGLVAGAFYALMNTLIETVTTLTIGDFFLTRFSQWIRTLPNIQPEVLEQLDRAVEQSGTFSLSGLILGLLFSVAIASVFSTAGGLIGGAVFKVDRPAPPPPPPPPVPQLPLPPLPSSDFGGQPGPPPSDVG